MPVGPLVTAVVVSYRHVDDTLRCVRSLQEQTFADLHVVVVDNTEDPAVRDRLAAALDPTVTYLASGGNVGFAAANNLGIDHGLRLGSAFLWLLNPDAVADPDTLERILAAAAAEPDAGILGCRILYGDSDPPTIWYDGGALDLTRGGASWHQREGRPESEFARHTRSYDVGYVTGAALVVRAEVVRTVGSMPEDYFLYFEETDWCVRAQQSGWRTMHVPTARVHHHKRSGTDLPAPYFVYYSVRNRLVFASRFTDVGPDAVMVSLQPFIARHREHVATLAPDWSPTYERLLDWAEQDGRAGVTGRRADIEQVSAPVPAGRSGS